MFHLFQPLLYRAPGVLEVYCEIARIERDILFYLSLSEEADPIEI